MTKLPTFSVDIEGPLAVYVQIENQVQFAIAAGRLKPGDTLPSVREMALMLNVNPNTVTKAYRDLELIKLVHPRRGVGVTVTNQAPKLCRHKARGTGRTHLQEAVAECVACGLSASEIHKIATATVNSGKAPYTAKKKG